MANSEWSELQRDDLKFMVESGFKQNEICEVLGKSIDTVRIEIKIMNLKSPRKYRKKDDKIFCLNCRQYKDETDFYKSRRHRLGLYVNCKTCCNKIDGERYHNKKLNEIREQENKNMKTKEEVNGNLYRVCSTCKEAKDVEEFNWKKTNVKLSLQCRTCSKESKRKSLLKRAEKKGY